MKKTTLQYIGLAVASMALGGCWGGSDDTPPPVAESNEIPASATASTTAFVNYAGSLAASEVTEPVDISHAVPPTSDTDEPAPI